MLKNMKLLLEARRNKACDENVENVEEYQVSEGLLIKGLKFNFCGWTGELCTLS